MTTVCLTFDHLGSAQRVGQGLLRRPDPDDPGATIGYPRILDLLAELDVQATFFIEGWSLLHYPQQVEDLLERGHEVALHGWVHERWSELPAGEQERILSDGLAVLRRAGIETAGFRAPHGCLAPQTPDLLADLGYRFDSSLLGVDDDPPRQPRRLSAQLVNVPFSWPMVDAWQYRIRDNPLTPHQLAGEWLDLARPQRANGSDVVTLVAHPHLSGVDPAASAAFEQVVRTLAADDTVTLRTLGGLATDFADTEAPSTDAPAADWLPYLHAHQLIRSDVPVEELSGGVSCVTVRAGDVVVKRARARLAVAGDWPADPNRILDEAAAISRFPGLAPPLLDVDVDQLVVAMEFVDGVCWKDELMAGRCDVEVARRAGVELRRIHAAPLLGLDGAHRFDTLRLTPYFTGLSEAIPEAARALPGVVDRLRATRTHLVHGDYSPKNFLVRRAADDVQLTVLDWEVACAGDPVFDVAFLLSHLVIKSVHLPHVAAELLGLCRAVLAEYGPVDEVWLRTVVGALLLARIEGLSTLTYLDANARAQVRVLGVGLITAAMKEPW